MYTYVYINIYTGLLYLTLEDWKAGSIPSGDCKIMSRFCSFELKHKECTLHIYRYKDNTRRWHTVYSLSLRWARDDFEKEELPCFPENKT